MNGSLTIFDLDETLIAGDSALIWHEFLVQQGIITEPNFLQEDQRLMGLYAIGQLDMQDYLDFTMAAISHVPSHEVDRLAEICVTEKILPHLYPQAKKLLSELQKQQSYLLMISATASFLVNKVAKHLGFNAAMGIDLALKNGCYSSQIVGIATYQSGKVQRLNQWLNTQKTGFNPISFYTDSINDLPLCLQVDKPVMVNPCALLTVHAKAYQWPILSW